jgi:sirohydrochlorin ferrochelatase
LKPAVLLVDHGSRRPEANALTDWLADALRAREPGRVVRVAHLEVLGPDIAEGVDACVADGAREIVVLPVFLAPGRHVLEDVPREAREAGRRHPDVSVRVAAEPLGTHPKLVEILLERLDRVGSGSG